MDRHIPDDQLDRLVGRYLAAQGTEIERMARPEAEVVRIGRGRLETGAGHRTSPAFRVVWLAALLVLLLALVVATLALVGSSPPPAHRYSGVFVPTGSMTTARYWHTATLLDDDRVLIAGGRGDTSSLATAEIYDPRTGTFSPTGSMSTERWGHAAARLPDGRALVFGGSGPLSAEVYDPRSGTFSPAEPPAGPVIPSEGTDGVRAVGLSDGRVLLVGISLGGLGRAQLYDPGSGAFQALDFDDPGAGVSATLLADGSRVLLIGGQLPGFAPTSAWIIDPARGTADPAGSLPDATFEALDHASRAVTLQGPLGDPSAVLLPDGHVLVVGGGATSAAAAPGSYPTDAADLFDPGSASFTPTGALRTVHTSPSVTLLEDGRVLVAGGLTWDGMSQVSGLAIRPLALKPSTAVAEVYDPSSETFALTGSMTIARLGQTATLLEDGSVLVTGGLNEDGHAYANSREALSSAELYR